MTSIYQQMSEKIIEIATTQIDILTHYFSQGRVKQLQELYDISHQSMIDLPSESSLEELEKVIDRFTDMINFYRIFLPEIENSEIVKGKLSELEKLMGSGSL